LYQKEKEGSQRQKLLLSYIEQNLESLLQDRHSAMKEIRPNTLKSILSSEKLNIEEDALFDLLIDWGKQQGGDLKVKVAEFLPLIRFPLFPSNKLAAKVAPLSLLDSPTLITLFSYTSKSDESKELPKDFPYSSKRREGFVPPCFWDEKNKDPGITLDEKKCGITWPNYDSIVRATRSFSGKDKFYWEVTWNGGNSIRIGVLDSTCTNYKNDLWQVGWAILGQGGSGSYVKGSQTNSSIPNFYSGEVLGFALDMERRTCTWYRNGQKVGIIFQDLPGQVWPAISNGTGPTTATTRFDLPYPKDA